MDVNLKPCTYAKRGWVSLREFSALTSGANRVLGPCPAGGRAEAAVEVPRVDAHAVKLRAMIGRCDGWIGGTLSQCLLPLLPEVLVLFYLVLTNEATDVIPEK